MPHVAVYQSGNTTSIAGASSGPNAHLGLSLLVFFCINPPFGKFIQTLHFKTFLFTRNIEVVTQVICKQVSIILKVLLWTYMAMLKGVYLE